MSKRKKQSDAPNSIRNSKAYHNYYVGEEFQAGIMLKGTEIKSIRSGKAQITESFVKFFKNEAFLYNAYIDEYKFGNLNNHEPKRTRKLLLNRKELNKLQDAVDAGGYTIVPLKIYFKKALAKVSIALCKGKKLHDKRESLKKKTDQREAERYMKSMRG